MIVATLGREVAVASVARDLDFKGTLLALLTAIASILARVISSIVVANLTPFAEIATSEEGWH